MRARLSGGGAQSADRRRNGRGSALAECGSACSAKSAARTYCPVSNLHCAPPPAFCMISLGPIVQCKLETLSMLEPAAPCEGLDLRLLASPARGKPSLKRGDRIAPRGFRKQQSSNASRDRRPDAFLDEVGTTRVHGRRARLCTTSVAAPSCARMTSSGSLEPQEHQITLSVAPQHTSAGSCFDGRRCGSEAASTIYLCRTYSWSAGPGRCPKSTLDNLVIAITAGPDLTTPADHCRNGRPVGPNALWREVRWT
jgi:hypothetical protein